MRLSSKIAVGFAFPIIVLVAVGLLARIVSEDAPSARLYRPEIWAGLDLVILRALERDRRRRYRNLEEFRERARFIRITGAASDDDAVLGLESGANDYVNKPFRFAVLLARIRAHLRQHDGSLDALFQIGSYTFSPGAKNLVSEAGDRMRLTEKEVAILRFLYRAGSQVVDRDTLLREVWGYNAAVTTHTLETHIYRLRQKIELDPTHAQLLVTEAGGYRLIP